MTTVNIMQRRAASQLSSGQSRSPATAAVLCRLPDHGNAGSECSTPTSPRPLARSARTTGRPTAAPLPAPQRTTPQGLRGPATSPRIATAASPGGQQPSTSTSATNKTADGPLTVPCRVVVPYHPTRHGQQLVLVGGCETLGSWEVNKGAPFEWCEGHTHTATIDLPIHTPVTCKLVVVGQDGSATWEPESDRELLLTPTSISTRAAGYTLFLHWGYPDCTQQLPNAFRRGAGGGSGKSSSRAGGSKGLNGAGQQTGDGGAAGRGALGGFDNPIIAGVRRALLAHASSARERFSVLPGIGGSWEEDPAAARRVEEEAEALQCQVSVLLPPSGPRLSPDQSLVLVGSSPALGRWDPAAGLPLEQFAPDSPMWVATADLPLAEGLQAKVVVVDAVSGKAAVWEPCENRSLAQLGGQRPVMVVGYWGVAATCCVEVDRLGAAAMGNNPKVVQVLREQLAATASQLDGLRKERDDARRAVATNEEQLKKLETEGGGKLTLSGRQEMTQLAAQLQTTRKLYDTAKREATELGGSVGVTRQLCDAAKREMVGLAAQLEAARLAYEALAPQVERMERQLATTTRAFEATQPEIAALETQLERARSLFDRTLQKIEAAKVLTASGEYDTAAVRRRVTERASASSVREIQFAKF